MGMDASRIRGRQGKRSRVGDLWADVWRWCLFACGVVFAVYLLLDRGVPNGAVTASVIACLAIGVVLTTAEPLAIVLMATPALLVTERLGVGSVDLTVSDAALAAALGAAVLLGRHDYSPPMRTLLWANLGYQFSTVFTVIVNPYLQNTIEWVHAWLLVSGALVAGWVVGRAGRARLVFTLFLAATALIAIGTFGTAIAQTVAGEPFQAVYPAWPWPMHKNFAGGMLAFGALVAYVNPPWARIDSRWARAAFVIFLIGLVLTQSRQAAIGLAIALLVHTLRRGAADHIVLVLVLAIPGAILVVQSVIEQIDSQNKFNSFYQRVDWLREVYALWKHSPLFGHGLRYWYVHPTADFQPPQAEVEVVASAGIFGLVGFVAMWAVMLVVLWRVNPQFGMLAFGLVLSRIVQAQFDLFWVAAQVSVPFFLAGLCLGAQAHAREQQPDTDLWVSRRKRSRRAMARGTLDRRLARAGVRPEELSV
ncbi:O-antigen ligase family protein [Microbacterium sp.]|uniref:O-antigen ligase family protein n=1 Tax=Microbacterium sp. TaxID=51671 RepID=UPI0028126C28|nr:O-antigen ligase family protein [Microbacterium sp.]